MAFLTTFAANVIWFGFRPGSGAVLLLVVLAFLPLGAIPMVVAPLTTNSAFFSFVAGFLHVLTPAALSAHCSGKRGGTGHAVSSANRTFMTSGGGSMTLSATATTVIIPAAAVVSISARSAFVFPKGPNLLWFLPLGKRGYAPLFVPCIPWSG